MKSFAAVLLLISAPLLAQADDSAMPRVLNAEAPTAGINTLALEVGVGEMHITASNDDKVHVQVTLRRKEREFMWFFHWMDGGTSKEIAAAAIQQKLSGDRLTLIVSYPHEGDGSDMKQEWDVQLPARLKLDAVMAVGDCSIEGVAGGVAAKLNVGELVIDVPRGAIDASVDVGEIRAKSASSQHGRIQLSSNIGDAMLVLKGTESGTHEHGGLGSRISLEGGGPDTMQLKVNIGEVSLHLEPADDAKHGAGK
jgi:hypothetical protein